MIDVKKPSADFGIPKKGSSEKSRSVTTWECINMPRFKLLGVDDDEGHFRTTETTTMIIWSSCGSVTRTVAHREAGLPDFLSGAGRPVGRRTFRPAVECDGHGVAVPIRHAKVIVTLPKPLETGSSPTRRGPGLRLARIRMRRQATDPRTLRFVTTRTLEDQRESQVDIGMPATPSRSPHGRSCCSGG